MTFLAECGLEFVAIYFTIPTIIYQPLHLVRGVNKLSIKYVHLSEIATFVTI